MKKTIFLALVLVILSLLVFPQPAYAQETNVFGIHILDPGEADQAAELVNSNGGDWGWVTIVLRDNDMDPEKWQNFFNQCRRKHLVPIVRLATHIEGNHWVKPTHLTIQQMAQFLNSLNWPTKKRYVTVFNEPNHAKEWGGEIAPQEYAVILDQTITVFKAADPNFQILNGGLDLAADNGPKTQNAFNFLQEMYRTQPQVFQRLDGWASHSYPNPGFVGQVTDRGKFSLRGYIWELYVLRTYFGLHRDLPIFITETGWPHQERSDNQPAKEEFYPAAEVAERMREAFELWQTDARVKAVTPFVLNYHAAPLDTFSWYRQDGQAYPQCKVIEEMPKKDWQPEQITSWEITGSHFPKFLPFNSQYTAQIILENTGQSIWSEQEICFASQSDAADDICLGKQKKIHPGESEIITISIQTPPSGQQVKLNWAGLKEEANINLFEANQISSYRRDFFQKILSIIKVWWYDKKRYEQQYPAAAQP